MTYVAEFLSSYMERSGVQQNTLAAASGCTTSYISKLVKGLPIQLMKDKLVGLMNALPEDQRRGLLDAYMLDIVGPEWEPYIRRPENNSVKETPAPYGADNSLKDLSAVLSKLPAPKRNRILTSLKLVAEVAIESPSFLEGVDQIAKVARRS